MPSGCAANAMQDLNGVTDDRVYQQLRRTDEMDGKWIVEDPSLQQLQALAQAANGGR